MSETPRSFAAPGAAPGAAPSVILMDDGTLIHVTVPPAAVDDVYAFLKLVTGYAVLEPWNFVLSRNDASTLIVAVYSNEDGRHENALNLGVSEILGVQLYGNAVVVCFQEFAGDDDGEGQYSSVVSLETLLRMLDERGEELPVHPEKIVSGRLGDLLHEIKRMLARRQAPTRPAARARGGIQGDPLEMTRFCLTVHPTWGRVMSRHPENQVTGYADDAYLMGKIKPTLLALAATSAPPQG